MDLSNIGSVAASRFMTAIAIGAFSTAAAGVGTAIILTGSASPAVWASAAQHAQECGSALAAQDPNCSAAAAQAWAQRQLAAQLEAEASQLRSKPTPAASPTADPGSQSIEPAPSAGGGAAPRSDAPA